MVICLATSSSNSRIRDDWLLSRRGGSYSTGSVRDRDGPKAVIVRSVGVGYCKQCRYCFSVRQQSFCTFRGLTHEPKESAIAKSFRQILCTSIH